MVRGILKAGVAAAIGFLSIFAGYFLLAVHNEPAIISDERFFAELVAPVALGLLVAVGVYRLLDR